MLFKQNTEKPRFDLRHEVNIASCALVVKTPCLSLLKTFWEALKPWRRHTSYELIRLPGFNIWKLSAIESWELCSFLASIHEEAGVVSIKMAGRYETGSFLAQVWITATSWTITFQCHLYRSVLLYKHRLIQSYDTVASGWESLKFILSHVSGDCKIFQTCSIIALPFETKVVQSIPLFLQLWRAPWR